MAQGHVSDSGNADDHGLMVSILSSSFFCFCFFCFLLPLPHASGTVDWPAFDWLPADCLPAVIQLALSLPPSEERLRMRLCTVRPGNEMRMTWREHDAAFSRLAQCILLKRIPSSASHRRRLWSPESGQQPLRVVHLPSFPSPSSPPPPFPLLPSSTPLRLQFLLTIGKVFGRFYLMAILLPIFLTAAGHSIDLSTLPAKVGHAVEGEDTSMDME